MAKEEAIEVVATVVASPGNPPPDGTGAKEIKAVLDSQPMVGPDIMELTRFVSEYYLCSWGEAIEAALPPDPGSRARVRMIARRPGAGLEQLPERAMGKKRLLAALPAGGEILSGEITACTEPGAREPAEVTGTDITGFI